MDTTTRHPQGARRAGRRAGRVAVWLAGLTGLFGPAVAETDPGSSPPAPEPRAVVIAELLDAVEAHPSKVVAVNVWATWCVPCREEFPDLLRFRDSTAREDFDLLFVSADFDPEEDGTVEFLTEMGVDFPSYLKEGDDQAFIDGLSPEWTGALPATVWFVDGRRVETHEGKIDFATLKESLARWLP